jgi:hypothetical protein
MDIVNVSWGFGEGDYLHQGGDLLATFSGYIPGLFDMQLEAYAWVRVDGIAIGDFVDIKLDWLTQSGLEGDCEVLAFWADTDNSTWTYNNNLLGRQMCTDEKPERGSFYADQSGALMIGIYCAAGYGGTYSLTVDFRNMFYNLEMSNEVILPIWDFIFLNSTCCLDFIGYAEDGTQFIERFTGITFNGLFSPEIQQIDISGSLETPFISWNVTDRNVNETIRSSLYVSSDGGSSYDILLRNTLATSYEWDATSHPLHNYKVRLTVTDSKELQDTDYSSFFEAGVETPLSISHPDDIEYVEGAMGETLTWYPRCGVALQYRVTLDGQSYRSGTWQQGQLRIILGTLSVGTHVFNITLTEPISEKQVSDSVNVTVLSDTPDDSTSDTSIVSNIPLDSDFVLSSFMTGITAGSLSLIIIVSAAIINAWRNKKGYWDRPYEIS